jgi:hypothetical protein
MPRLVFNTIKEKIIGKGLMVEKQQNFSGKKGGASACSVDSMSPQTRIR